jgi:hypothetical protein
MVAVHTEPKRYVTGRVYYLRLMLQEYGAAFRRHRQV